MKSIFLILLTATLSFAWAGQQSVGDEVAGEAYVSWEAVVKKVNESRPGGQSIKASVEFYGHTREGKQIRGAGVLRFFSEDQEAFEVGERYQGNDLLRYWATIKTVMGGDLAILKGTAVLGFSRTDSLVTTEGVIDLKAALDID